jgi:hypothetical protein
MPNQKQRKKKAGVNKIKKVTAMREKEAVAKPRRPPSATGKGIRETSKRDSVKDRQSAFNRA